MGKGPQVALETQLLTSDLKALITLDIQIVISSDPI